MELRGGRGNELEVEDTPPHVQPTTHGTTAPRKRYYREAARNYRGRPRYYRDNNTGRNKPDGRAVLPLSRYYRSPLRYYRKAEGSRPGKGADEINYIRAYFHRN